MEPRKREFYLSRISDSSSADHALLNFALSWREFSLTKSLSMNLKKTLFLSHGGMKMMVRVLFINFVFLEIFSFFFSRKNVLFHCFEIPHFSIFCLFLTFFIEILKTLPFLLFFNLFLLFFHHFLEVWSFLKSLWETNFSIPRLCFKQHSFKIPNHLHI